MMPALVLLIVLAVIVFLLVKSVQDAKRAGTGDSTDPVAPSPRQAARPKARPKPRQRRAKPVIDQEALAAHVAKLREAVAADLISMDEAIASVVRQTDGALSDEAARKLLDKGDAA